MLLPPAPPQILEQISCGCKKGCKTRSCSCRAHGISCTEFCRCKGCTNAANEDHIEQDEGDEHEEGFDEDQLQDMLEEEVDADDDVDFSVENERFENVLKVLTP